MDRHSPAFLKCAEPPCERRYAINDRIYTCTACGGLLDVGYEFDLPDPAETKRLFASRRTSTLDPDLSGVWRFRELLPFAGEDDIVTLKEGNTPMYEGPRSGSYAGVEKLTFKHQGLNPTGSFKDNGMTTGVTQARTLGASAVACASTGNTSASMSAYAARAGIRAVVFIPADQVAYGKISQSIEYGATVVEIEGNFDDAMRLVRELADETGMYLLNSINPFRLEGQKAIAIEMLEQLGWEPPAWIVLPGGNLGNSSAIGKGLKELGDLRFIRRLPRIAIVQASGAAPFYKLVSSAERKVLTPNGRPETLATAIKIGNPVSWKKALRAIEWTDGVVEQVSEQEIADSKAIIGRDGIGCEPASAATLAGIKRLVERGVIKKSDSVVAVLTGNLLKDPDYTIRYHNNTLKLNDIPVSGNFANKPVRTAADKDEIRRALHL